MYQKLSDEYLGLWDEKSNVAIAFQNSSYLVSILLYSRATTGYWISFQDGLQRTALFTASQYVSNHVLMGNRTEQPIVDITLSLTAMGLSLVNDVKGREIAYIGIPQ